MENEVKLDKEMVVMVIIVRKAKLRLSLGLKIHKEGFWDRLQDFGSREGPRTISFLGQAAILSKNLVL